MLGQDVLSWNKLTQPGEGQNFGKVVDSSHFVQRQTLTHVAGKGSIRIDVLPLEWRQRPQVGGGQAALPLELDQNLLNHQGLM